LILFRNVNLYIKNSTIGNNNKNMQPLLKILPNPRQTTNSIITNRCYWKPSTITFLFIAKNDLDKESTQIIPKNKSKDKDLWIIT